MHNKRVDKMISYEPLWETMKEQGISTYALIHKFDINASTVHSLKHNQNITMYTLERLCEVLNCTPDSIVKFVRDKE